MPSWNAFSFAFGPLFAAALIGLLILILRWSHRRGASVVAAPPRQGTVDEYGLLVPVASPTNFIEGEVLRQTLEASGIRANLATTLEGPRVLVWPADLAKATKVLRNSPESRG
jgi:hypothetical protein